MSARDDIVVHIDELVLHGFAAGDGEQIGRAVQRELARQLAGIDGERLAGLGQIERLDAGSFRVAPGAGPDAIGGAVAHSVMLGAKGGMR